MPKQLNYAAFSDSDSNDEESRGEDEGIALGANGDVKPKTSNTRVILWSGINKKIPVLNFSPHTLLVGLQPEGRDQITKYHLAFKFVKTECKLVRNLLSVHGFREVHPNSSDFNLMWTGSHLKPYTLRGMHEFQKINHFPRSYELTRKDRLYKNVQRMQHAKGKKHFNFIPDSYVLPGEFNEFYAHFVRDKGPWIVKPVALSRGRGIYLVNHPSQIPLDEHLLICKYLSKPLLIDGFKLDLRLYVGVTCFDPLRIYLYEEGLTRFATVKYDKSGKNIRNSCMHLTNYSVNKKSADFVRCLDPEVEDYGNKWSMSAMLRFLKQTGRDTTALMLRIEDLVIKTVIAGELPIASACKMFMPFPGNCFEIFGFDVLVDENLRPWLLEVNLSPSLACDSPLDLKIKSHLVSDMLNTVGFVAHDPLVRKFPIRRLQVDLSQGRGSGYRKQRAQSAGAVPLTGSSRGSGRARRTNQEDGLTVEEIRVLRHTREEYNRRGGFVRIFPSPTSWELYGSFLEHRTTHNQMIHARLFPDRMSANQRPTTASYSSATARARNLTSNNGDANEQTLPLEPKQQMSSSNRNGQDLPERLVCYERKLDSWSPSPSQSSLSSQSGVISSETPTMVSSSRDMHSNTNPPDRNLEVQLRAERSSRDMHSNTNPPDRNVEVQLRAERTSRDMHSNTNPPIRNIAIELQLRAEGSKERNDSGVDPVGSSAIVSHATGSLRQGELEVRVPSVVHQRPKPPRSHETEVLQNEPAPTVNGTVRPYSAKPLSAQLLHKYNSIKVDDIMNKAGSLKKIQARQAFAMYLQRVQQRLVHEVSYDSDDSCRDETDTSRQDEQMSLVIRFLKRAASNLQQPFKVIVPSHKLPLHDRRRILAKQLGDFVHVYGKETAQLQKRQEIYRIYKLGRESETEIPEEDFKVFMATASETELEDLLTKYTKLNKNASVFLGGKPESVKSDNTSATADAGEGTGTGLMRRRGSTDYVRPNKSTNYEGGWTKAVVEDLGSTESVGADKRERHSRAVTAVSAYGSSVALNRTRQRPASARIASAQQGDRGPRNTRPVSAKVSRENATNIDTDDGDVIAKSVSRSRLQRTSSASAVRTSSASAVRRDKFVEGETKGYKLADEHAVAVALQRLAKRQAARQYSALNKTSANGHNWAELFSKMDFTDDTTANQLKDEDFVSVTGKTRKHDKQHRESGHERHLSANSTFNTFVGFEKRPSGDGDSDSQTFWQDASTDRHASSREITHSIGRHATGHSPEWRSLVHVDLKSHYSAVEEDRDAGRRGEKERERERKRKEKSRPRDRAREEYNKHIRMISQKLAEQQQQQQLQQQHPALPHPPPRPSGARKPISAQRIARLAAGSASVGAYDLVTGVSTAAGDYYTNGVA